MRQLRFAVLWMLAVPGALLFAAVAVIAARISGAPQTRSYDTTTIA